MIKEDKQLLLVDLCARLPYGVKVQTPVMNDEITLTCDDISAYFFNPDNKVFLKPYLRPLSSMTEEEREEYRKFSYYGAAGMRDNDFTEMVAVPSFEKMDYLNSHHFDYRGLIKKGLAIKAPEGMYN
jgi:hypothetical protein